MYACEDLYSRMCARANPAGSPPLLTDIAGTQVVLPFERRFGRIDDVEAYIDSAMHALRAMWPDASAPEVRRRKGEAMAHWEPPGVIAIPESVDLLREHVVIHELAHHVAWELGVGTPSHGSGFRSVLCQIHSLTSGPSGGWALGVLFDQHGLAHGRV